LNVGLHTGRAAVSTAPDGLRFLFLMVRRVIAATHR